MRAGAPDVPGLRALTAREASIFACLTDTVVQPRAPLPPVRETDAVASFDRWMALSPPRNRIGFRALLYAIEVGPLLTGLRGRLRRLDPPRRRRYVRALERARNPSVRELAKLVKGMAFVSYYGDERIMRMLGYDADAKLRRGRELRARDGRP